MPIVGPAVATLLAMLARSIGAERVFELGSAIGYSTAFFARAVGRGGQVFYTDGSAENAEQARVSRALGLLDRVAIRVGEAVARSRPRRETSTWSSSTSTRTAIRGARGRGAARPPRRLPAGRQRALVGPRRGRRVPRRRHRGDPGVQPAALRPAGLLERDRAAARRRGDRARESETARPGRDSRSDSGASPRRDARPLRGGPPLGRARGSGARISRRARERVAELASRVRRLRARHGTARGAPARALRGGGPARRHGDLRRSRQLLRRARAGAAAGHADHALDRGDRGRRAARSRALTESACPATSSWEARICPTGCTWTPSTAARSATPRPLARGSARSSARRSRCSRGLSRPTRRARSWRAFSSTCAVPSRRETAWRNRSRPSSAPMRSCPTTRRCGASAACCSCSAGARTRRCASWRPTPRRGRRGRRGGAQLLAVVRGRAVSSPETETPRPRRRRSSLSTRPGSAAPRPGDHDGRGRALHALAEDPEEEARRSSCGNGRGSSGARRRDQGLVARRLRFRRRLLLLEVSRSRAWTTSTATRKGSPGGSRCSETGVRSLIFRISETR